MLEEFSALPPSFVKPKPTPEFVACPVASRAEALNLLYRSAARGIRGLVVADLLADAAEGRLDLSGLWVARHQGQILGSFLTQRLAGRAAAVWPPEVKPFWGRSKLAAELVSAALLDLKRQGFGIVQALIDPNDPPRRARALSRSGVPHVTDLVYLARSTAEPLELDCQVPRLAWQGFGPETETEFQAVLQATYQGSLDMPELEGARSLDDVLAGHREAGRFDPERWRLGRLPGSSQAVAVVLLTTHPDRDAWEVAYLGLIPSARGRGLGRAALAHAIDCCRPSAKRLELAVDVRNHPAKHLYLGAGFIPFDRRMVHLALL